MAKPEAKKSVAELISEDEKCRVQNCKNAIETALREFNCELQVAMLVTTKGNLPQIQIVAKPAQN